MLKQILSVFYFQTKINIISRKTGKLCRVFNAEAFFYLHIINQFEKEDNIILDICVYKDPSMLSCMYIDAMKVNILLHLFYVDKLGIQKQKLLKKCLNHLQQVLKLKFDICFACLGISKLLLILTDTY